MSFLAPLALPDEILTPWIAFADACGDEQAISCRLVYHWTGNETASQIATWVVGKPLAILVLIVVGLVIRALSQHFIDRIIGATGNLSERRRLRARTIGSLLRSVITTLIVAIISVMILSELGYEVGPLIASAGVVGLAIGFGAQNLVKDYLAGLFMILEDQYGVGDVIDVGTTIGTVEAVGLRITRLHDDEGTVWYVRNGEILRVGNKSQRRPHGN
jgi:small conductance mechanosensitive channel